MAAIGSPRSPIFEPADKTEPPLFSENRFQDFNIHASAIYFIESDFTGHFADLTLEKKCTKTKFSE